LIFNRTFGGVQLAEEWSIPEASTRTSDGGIAFTYTKAAFFNGGMWFIKMDHMGLVEWNRSIDGVASVRQLQQTTDDGFIASLLIERETYIEYAIAKYDSRGVQSWNRSLEAFNFDETHFWGPTNDIELVSGDANSFFIMGRVPEGFRIVKMNSEGETQWNEIYQTGVESMFLEMIGLVDGNLAYLSLNQWDGNEITLHKVDRDGNPVWSKTFNDPSSTYIKHNRFFIQTIDGGFLIGTSPHNDNGGNFAIELWLTKTDHRGEIEWQMPVGGLHTGFHSTSNLIMIQLASGELILGGRTYELDNSQIRLIKLESIGTVNTHIDTIYTIGEVLGEIDQDYTLDEVFSNQSGEANNNLLRIIGTIAIGVFVVGVGSFSIYQIKIYRGISSLTVKKSTLDKLKELFDGQTSQYLLLVNGILSQDREYTSGTHIPKEIFELKFLLHPVRMSIMKLVTENPLSTSREIRERLNLSWGEFSTHIGKMKKENYLETKDQFIDGVLRQVMLATEVGNRKYLKLVSTLNEFLNTQNVDNYLDKAQL